MSAAIECRFRYQCPRKWSELAPTTTDDVRYCDQCQRRVFLIHSDQGLELAQHAGLCVAMEQGLETMVGEPEPSVRWRYSGE